MMVPYDVSYPQNLVLQTQMDEIQKLVDKKDMYVLYGNTFSLKKKLTAQ